MSDEVQENHNSGLLYFMPAWIFEAKDLSNTEKLVYSLLSGLAFGKENKECFPSDEYIGKRLGISRQQANECVGNLEKFGALSKRTVPNEKNPFRKVRYIQIYLENQKSFTKSGKGDSRDDEKADSPLSGKADSSNKVYSNKEKEENLRSLPKAPNKEKFIDHVFLSKEEYSKLLGELGEAKTKEMIKRLDAYIGSKGRKYKSHYKTILSWILKDEKDKIPPENIGAKKGMGMR